MINGMGEALTLHNCSGATVRNCVFYNNFIRALTVWQRDPESLVTLTHNLFCDTLPQKWRNAFIRLSDLHILRSANNAYFARKSAAERHVVEAAKVGGKPVGFQGSGQYHGAKYLLEAVRKDANQEQGSRFGNPGLRAVAQLVPADGPRRDWLKAEMHWDGKAFGPLDFADFMIAPDSELARGADGKPIGPDPAAFR
jgi:hypothetical protein